VNPRHLCKTPCPEPKPLKSLVLAWLRLDDTGTLFHLTDRSAQPMQGLLADLQLNVAAALAAAPHVRGIVLSSGVMVNPGNARDETAWGASRSANADRTRASSPYTR